MSTLRGIIGLGHEAAQPHPSKRQRTALEGAEGSSTGQSPSVESGVQLSRTLENKIDHLTHMVQQLSRHGRHQSQSPAGAQSTRTGPIESSRSQTESMAGKSPGYPSAAETEAVKAGFTSPSAVIETGAKGYLDAEQENEPRYAGNTHFAYVAEELSIIRDYSRRLRENVQGAASSNPDESIGRP